MRYYKFVAAERIGDLLSGFVRFTQPGAFNDPFEIPAMKLAEIEAQPNSFLSAAMDQTRDIQAGFAANPFMVPAAAMRPVMTYWGMRSPDAPRISDEERARMLEESKERIGAIDDTFGILSLCSDQQSAPARENFLLWAHYADEHRGAAVEIDIDAPEFTASYSDKGGAEKRGAVNYVPERPGLPIDEEILSEHFFNKSLHWKYENEFRIVRDIAQHDKKIELGSGPPIYLFRLPSSCIRSITLGARVDDSRRDELAELIEADEHFRHIVLEKATLDPQRFALSFAAVG